MSSNLDLIESTKIIAKALAEFVRNNESNNVYYELSLLRHVHFIVGSDRFKGIGPAECQDLIWDHLTRLVSSDHISFCSSIRTVDAAEFEEITFPQSGFVSDFN